MLDAGDQRAPIIQVIAQHHRPQPVDMITAEGLKKQDLLILAQPGLLQPRELVDLDAWIRAGGRALIFADPDLRWPSALAMGDPRRAPPVTLLDPLFTHWGLKLETGVPDGPVDTGNGTLETFGRGRWQAGTTACAVAADGLIARCRIGSGRAVLVADADGLEVQSDADAQGAVILALIRSASDSPSR